jgi:hypothetical protein
MPKLDDLVARYLSPAVTPHREDSSVELVVDGRVWMRRMHEMLTGLGPGDAAYICGLQLDRDMDLTGKTAGRPGFNRSAICWPSVKGMPISTSANIRAATTASSSIPTCARPPPAG